MASPRIAAGFDRIFYGYVNASGFVIGSTATGAAAGGATGQGVARLIGGRTIPIGIPEDEIVTPTGDNEPKASFKFPSAELPSGVLEVAVRDLDFDALVQGTKVESQADFNIGSLGPSGSTSPDIALLLQRQAKKQPSGSGAWEILFVNRSNITPLGSDVTERTFSPYRYGINVSKSDRGAWGATFTELVHGYTQTALSAIESDNPVLLHTFQGNAAATAFTLPVTPKASTKILVYLNNVKQLITTHYTVSGATITFLSAPASGAYVNVLYEVDAGDLP